MADPKKLDKRRRWWLLLKRRKEEKESKKKKVRMAVAVAEGGEVKKGGWLIPSDDCQDA